MECVSSFEHRGTRMVLVDFSGAGLNDILSIVDAARDRLHAGA